MIVLRDVYKAFGRKEVLRGFSLEAPEGVRFLIRSRLLTDEEFTRLESAPPPRTGADLE